MILRIHRLILFEWIDFASQKSVLQKNLDSSENALSIMESILKYLAFSNLANIFHFYLCK